MFWWIMTHPRYCFRIWRLYGVPPWQVYAEVQELKELGREFVQVGQALQDMSTRMRQRRRP